MKSAEQQQHFLAIDEEAEAEFFEAPTGELETEVNEIEEQTDQDLSPIPAPIPKKRNRNRVSFNEKVTDLQTQEEYSRYFEAYVTRCYSGCFDSKPSCGIRVRTDTRSWVVRRSLNQLVELRDLMLKQIDSEGPEEEPVPEVGLTLDTTSNFLLYVLRNWKGAKSTANDHLSVLLGFSNHACGVENYCPYMPTIEERSRRRLEGQDDCHCCTIL